MLVKIGNHFPKFRDEHKKYRGVNQHSSGISPLSIGNHQPGHLRRPSNGMGHCFGKRKDHTAAPGGAASPVPMDGAVGSGKKNRPL